MRMLNLKRRGSALAYVLIVVAGTAVSVVAMVGLAGQAFRHQVSLEQKKVAQYVAEGSLAQIRSEVALGTVVPPLTKNVTVGNYSTSVTVTDNGSVVPNTYKVAGTTSISGRSYLQSFIMGYKADNIYNYGTSIGSSTTLSRSHDTYGGGMYVAGNLTVNNTGSSAAGDLIVTGSIGGTGTMAVTGTTTSASTPLDWPTLSAANYQAAADVVYGSTQSFSGGTFPSNNYLVYVNGNVTLSGTFTGNGTIFCTGSVQCNGSMAYGNASSHLVVIAMGGWSHGAAGASPLGIFFINGTMSFSKSCTFGRGIIVAKTFSQSSNTTAVTFDPYFKNNPAELANMHMPGFWP